MTKFIVIAVSSSWPSFVAIFPHSLIFSFPQIRIFLASAYAACLALFIIFIYYIYYILYIFSILDGKINYLSSNHYYSIVKGKGRGIRGRGIRGRRIQGREIRGDRGERWIGKSKTRQSPKDLTMRDPCCRCEEPEEEEEKRI